MNYYYLVFLILLIFSGMFFSNVVNKISGFFVSGLGIVALTAYLYYTYFKDTGNDVDEWPNESYLRDGGAQCPNYWKMVPGRQDDAEVKCIYVGENINIQQPCYDSKDGNGSDVKYYKSFTRANIKYPLQISKDREEWLNSCKYELKESSNSFIKPPWVEYDI